MLCNTNHHLATCSDTSSRSVRSEGAAGIESLHFHQPGEAVGRGRQPPLVYCEIDMRGRSITGPKRQQMLAKTHGKKRAKKRRGKRIVLPFSGRRRRSRLTCGSRTVSGRPPGSTLMCCVGVRMPVLGGSRLAAACGPARAVPRGSLKCGGRSCESCKRGSRIALICAS